jgi:transcription initiation factor IIE alpha subunit
MEPTIERLYDGIFECPSCEIEYGVERATEDDLFCEQCGGDLVEVGEDDDLDEDAEPVQDEVA